MQGAARALFSRRAWTIARLRPSRSMQLTSPHLCILSLALCHGIDENSRARVPKIVSRSHVKRWSGDSPSASRHPAPCEGLLEKCGERTLGADRSLHRGDQCCFGRTRFSLGESGSSPRSRRPCKSGTRCLCPRYSRGVLRRCFKANYEPRVAVSDDEARGGVLRLQVRVGPARGTTRRKGSTGGTPRGRARAAHVAATGPRCVSDRRWRR